jgi:uncharacterized protein (TIGR00297 family)
LKRKHLLPGYFSKKAELAGYKAFVRDLMALRFPGKTIFHLSFATVAAMAAGYTAWQVWQYGQFRLPDHLGLGLISVGGAMLLSVALRKIDLSGGLVGSLIAIFLGGGFSALLLLLIFFVAGSLASRWKLNWKESQGLAEKNRGRRSVVHAVSNGGVAAICGLCAWVFPGDAGVWLTMLAASLAAATGDTLSSELGNVYGRRYFNILNGKPESRGLDGVISLEGSLIGAAGSLLLAGAFAVKGGVQMGIVVVIAGILGNIVDSLLGATLQRWGWLSNHAVNFANTLAGAAIGWMGTYWIG